MTKILIFFSTLIIILLILVIALLGYLTFTEYMPSPTTLLSNNKIVETTSVSTNESLSIVSMNTGYGGLDTTQDFFMDGGKTSGANNKETVSKNIDGINKILKELDADIYLLQEVDQNSSRSFNINQLTEYQNNLGLNSSFAYNYRCNFVPIPWPPIGNITSGVANLSKFDINNSTRISLPVPFTWPIRIANMKRCLLVEYLPINNSDKELVLVNTHLEAYVEGDGRQQQLNEVMELLINESKKGNYVIVGGDFNANFEDANYELTDTESWQPGKLNNNDLPTGFSYAFDDASPTCRSLKTPYTGNLNNMQYYYIDGFIVSNNVKVNSVKTVDYDFVYSDHNPVKIEVELIK